MIAVILTREDLPHIEGDIATYFRTMRFDAWSSLALLIKRAEIVLVENRLGPGSPVTSWFVVKNESPLRSCEGPDNIIPLRSISNVIKECDVLNAKAARADFGLPEPISEISP